VQWGFLDSYPGTYIYLNYLYGSDNNDGLTSILGGQRLSPECRSPGRGVSFPACCTKRGIKASCFAYLPSLPCASVGVSGFG
jgi:hypothetical protein